MIPQRLLRYFVIFNTCYFLNCSSTRPFITPLPPEKYDVKKTKTSQKQENETQQEQTSSAQAESMHAVLSEEDTLDFALAFVDSSGAIDQKTIQEPQRTESDTAQQEHYLPHMPLEFFPVSHSMVRVALIQNISRIVIYSFGTVQIADGKKAKGSRTFQGRMVGKTGYHNRSAKSLQLEIQSGAHQTVALPCTLLAVSAQNYFECNGTHYRGSIILTRGKKGTFSVLNYCHVEDYLQGVVPLEIGKRSQKDSEALKAQAVAARTYTYKRMLVRSKQSFDLLPTVADQVYGGINVEYPLSNQAVQQTKGWILLHADTLIYAYYHSTCGGRTANVEEVWNKPPMPYLRSIADQDADGNSYCSISAYYRWKESWRTPSLSSIMHTFSTGIFPQRKIMSGTVQKIAISERFACGRVRLCKITTTSGTYECGGDRIRFLIRRNSSEYPILRSASFDVVTADQNKVILQGRGYGHGVGMCQMGAIGRARAGQNYKQILSAYYTATVLKKVIVTNN